MICLVRGMQQMTVDQNKTIFLDQKNAHTSGRKGECKLSYPVSAWRYFKHVAMP